MSEQRFHAVRELLEADPSIAAAIVYGSGARGQLRADSDLDVAVLRTREPADSGAPSMLDELGALGNAAGRDVHLTHLESADCALRRSIFAHGVTLFDRSNGALKQLERTTSVEYVDWEYARRLNEAGQRRQLEQARGRP